MWSYTYQLQPAKQAAYFFWQSQTLQHNKYQVSFLHHLQENKLFNVISWHLYLCSTEIMVRCNGIFLLFNKWKIEDLQYKKGNGGISKTPSSAAFFTILRGRVPFWNINLEIKPPLHQVKSVGTSWLSSAVASTIAAIGFLPRLPGLRFWVDPAAPAAEWVIEDSNGPPSTSFVQSIENATRRIFSSNYKHKSIYYIHQHKEHDILQIKAYVGSNRCQMLDI